MKPLKNLNFLKKLICLLILIIFTNLVYASDVTPTGQEVCAGVLSNYLICDDFDDGSLNTTIWQVIGSPTYVEENDYLKQNHSARVLDAISTAAKLFNDTVDWSIIIKFSCHGGSATDCMYSGLDSEPDWPMPESIALVGGTGKIQICGEESNTVVQLGSNYTVLTNKTNAVCFAQIWENKTNVENKTSVFTDNDYYFWGFPYSNPNDLRWYYFAGWMGTPEDAPYIVDTTPASITFRNLTSGNVGGDTNPPYDTNDTTPTFRINTNKNASCAIDNEDLNYTTMIEGDSERNCSTTGSTSHVCTLQPSDGLIINETTGYVYIACRDTIGNENVTSTSGALEISLQNLPTVGEGAIEAGIKASTIWPATVYTNQQVYIRNLNNDQVLGTFDKVASYELQRWAFNYLTSTETPISNLFNLTTAFYATEYQYLTFKEVNESVRDLIDDTS